MFDQSCKQNCDETSRHSARSLYIHVPLCLAKCRYCDFYSLPLDSQAADRFVRMVCRELGLHRDCIAQPLETLFIGGGTPTALGTSLLTELLASLGPLIDNRTEFSVEANPGTFDDSVASALARGGVNRVNFGVQSFRDSELRTLGRIHDARQAGEAVRLARSQGFPRVGLDLIYGVPGQSLQDWQDNLRQAMDLGIDHLSCYALSFEPLTPLGQDLARGAVTEMPEQEQKACYQSAIDLAGDAGFEHYEISNFARQGARCRHNLTYWRNETYLGLGPAAASYIDAVRRTNRPDLSAYLLALESNSPPPADCETLPLRGRMAETAMLGLRLIEGLDRRAFAQRFGMDPVEAFPQSIRRYADQDALIITPSHIRLAQWTLFASDTILADIISET
jgi:oxygen-independent coproporphyrinogen-3 oxidase